MEEWTNAGAAGGGADASAPDASPREGRIVAGNGRTLQRQQSRGWKFDAVARQRFLDTLAATCNVCESARTAGVALTTAYRARQRDARFAKAWQRALEIGYERLEIATLGYLLDRMDGEAIDPEAAPADAADLTKKMRAQNVSAAEMQLVMAMLARRHGAIDRAPHRGGRIATAEETDALIAKKLDALGRDRKKA